MIFRAAALLISILTIVAGASAQAAPSEKEQRKLAETLTTSKQKIVEAEAEKRRILGSLYSIQKKMKKISADKNHLTDELIQAQDGVKGVAKVIAGLESEIAKQKIQLRKRLRALYKMSGQGYLGILFSQTNATDLDETLRFLKIVTDNDYKLIRSYRDNVATYIVQRNKLKAQVERLVVIEKRIKKQEGLLAAQQESRSKIVSELDRQRLANLDKVKTLRRKAETTSDTEMDELLKPSIYEQKGMLPSPVAAYVDREFGLITDEKYKLRYSHKGWTFEAGASSPVTAIFEGTVAKTSFVPGYGTTVVIDHGDHYYSVYAHVARLRAKQGDVIKKGQAFAETSPVSGLYFEIRHFSEPENPARWIAAQRPYPTAQAD